jgi:signal transduction histidine kinase
MNFHDQEATRILLVDDNPTNLKVLSEALSGQGWIVLFATDGETAIEQTEYARPDLILLDVMMPGMSGFEVCQYLKYNPLTMTIPIIFMTALSDTADKVKGLELGAVDYITKPFQQAEAIARIRLHLKLNGLTQLLEEQNSLLHEKVVEQEATEAQLQKLMRELEYRVEVRTAELSRSLQQLQQTQLQLIQSEKLSTLGQLVAGVAHEINNPIGFITGNINHAEQYIQDLLNLVQLYQAQFPDPGVTIAEAIEDIDLDFLAQDLPNLIASLKQGTNRIREISNSLRIFARADSDSKVEFDLHEGIDSTLLILKHRLKANDRRPAIEVIKEYGELPAVQCYAGQLNQVFMNILANAIDACDEAFGQGQGSDPRRITIRTGAERSQNRAIVGIEDNGLGMPSEVSDRIFDCSFTTKAVGKGTGLGLSISRQIVEQKHGGQLRCVSVPGKGTEFIIELPMNDRDRFIPT